MPCAAFLSLTALFTSHFRLLFSFMMLHTSPYHWTRNAKLLKNRNTLFLLESPVTSTVLSIKQIVYEWMNQSISLSASILRYSFPSSHKWRRRETVLDPKAEKVHWSSQGLCLCLLLWLLQPGLQPPKLMKIDPEWFFKCCEPSRGLRKCFSKIDVP